jgi:type I restriction enzyme M protein
MLENINISIPLDETGKFSIIEQQEKVNDFKSVDEIKASIREYKNQINNLKVEIEEDFKDIKYKEFVMSDVFNVIGGNARLTKKVVEENKGKYIVYSANTKEGGIFGYINTFDHDTECIQITTNGVYAGTIFYRMKHKFSINGDARLLIKNSDRLDYNYLVYRLETAFSYENFNWENKPTLSKLNKIKILIPVLDNEEYDYETQLMISSKNCKILEIKRLINIELEKIADTNIDFM